MATSTLSYQTATEYISSPMYRKASSTPEYFDVDNDKEEIKQDPFESAEEEEDDCSDPFSEVDEFLDNESDPFIASDEDPFLLQDIDPFLVDDRDPFYEVDEFKEGVDPFIVDDIDVFNANTLDAGIVTDEYDGDDPFLIEDEEFDVEVSQTKQQYKDSIIEMIFTLKSLGVLCLLVALLILFVNH